MRQINDMPYVILRICSSLPYHPLADSDARDREIAR